ncbi:MAG: T9SS type A sorting domain-containing protein [Flavobacteriales bacterium]|nr:T9SS type A sorting domain-containing protein [Flavobacteriales bacterium]
MKSLLILPALLMCKVLGAQGDYQLTHFTADYLEITDGEVLAEDNWFAPEIEIALDFTFDFGGAEMTTLSQIGVGAEWGAISATALDIMSYGALLNSSAGAGDPGAPSIISWVTEGAVGSRILKIQYKDAAFLEEVLSSGTAENRVNFQLWFYEQGGAFEFRFGPSNIVNPNSAYINLPGPPIYFFGGADELTGNINFGGAIAGDPAAPVLLSFDNSVDYFDELYGPNPGPVALSGTPAEGQVYRLSSQTVSVIDYEDHTFELFPTLAQHEVFFRGDLTPGMPYRIVNITGAAVASGVLSANRIDVSGLASGMYLLQIDGTSTAQKFVKR